MSEIHKKFHPDRYEASFTVTGPGHQMRLDQFVLQFMGTLSREYIKKKIKAGEIKIVGAQSRVNLRPSTKVLQGDRVEFVTYKNDEFEAEFWNGEKLDLVYQPEIIFEDENIIAISKPPFMSTHPTGKHLFNCATVYFEAIHGHTIHSIHRLDRETSGILILGKNPQHTNELTLEFERRNTQKTYFFIAHKKNINSYPLHAKERLGQKGSGIDRVYVDIHAEESSHGKSAQTTFDVLWEDDHYFIGLAFPKTGRQHQIRAHAAHYGLPLLGDKIYNGDINIFKRYKDKVSKQEDFEKMQIPRHALHALSLEINYLGQKKKFIAPLPLDLMNWMENYKKGLSTIIASKLQSNNQALH